MHGEKLVPTPRRRCWTAARHLDQSCDGNPTSAQGDTLDLHTPHASRFAMPHSASRGPRSLLLASVPDVRAGWLCSVGLEKKEMPTRPRGTTLAMTLQAHYVLLSHRMMLENYLCTNENESVEPLVTRQPQLLDKHLPATDNNEYAIEARRS